MNTTVQIEAPASRTVTEYSVSSSLRRIIRFLFSADITLAVAAAVAVLMVWYNVSTPDAALASRKVATAALFLTPWAIVWGCRSTFSKKGGEA